MKESFDLLSVQNKSIQASSDTIQKQNEALIRQIEDLKEQIAILTQHRFGKSTETKNPISGQLSFDLENMCVLNEAEMLVANGIPEEPQFEKVIVRRKRTKGKRDINLKDIETETLDHDVPEEELKERFPNGYHSLKAVSYTHLTLPTMAVV